MHSNQEVELYFGLDVQIKRDCSYCVLNSQLDCVETGWLSGDTVTDICHSLADVLNQFEQMGSKRIAIGIDAPRLPLTKPREYYWNRNQWRKRGTKDRGYGRHCEVVLKALNIANPQWTPLVNKAPPWMQLGFGLFESLENLENVFEVFPTASYRMLQDRKYPKVSIGFANFVHGPKDMLDACIAAVTVHEYMNGRGCEVGGGDGLGTIVLPTELSPELSSRPVLRWPSKTIVD